VKISKLCFCFGGKRIKKKTDLHLKGKGQQIMEETERAEILFASSQSFCFSSHKGGQLLTQLKSVTQ